MLGEKRELTDAEIVGVLSHTRLPTIVLEGKTDLFAFRFVGKSIDPSKFSLLPVGGKGRVIFAYNNRPPNSNEVPILFFLDRDEWIFDSDPEFVDGAIVLTTDGFSIENDLIRDGNVVGLMSPAEYRAFEHDLQIFSPWQAVQISRKLSGGAPPLSKFPGIILDDESVRDADCALANGEQYPHEIAALIAGDPLRFVRGKSLIQIIMRQLNAPTRDPRHSPKPLLESCANANGSLLARIVDWIRSHVE